MKYFIVAGEPSGDIHGANLIKGLKRYDTDAVINCFGGDLMENAGGKVKLHYREMAFMGIWEVLIHLRAIFKNLRLCRKNISEFDPDAVILIDYPGFNLKIARYAKQQGFKVYYYISPKVWAWKKSRAKIIKRYVDRLFTILPFETEYFKKYFNYEVDYVGNPLLDEMQIKNVRDETEKDFIRRNNLKDKPVIALLSGSRKQEIERCLPEMLEAVKDNTEYQFVIAGVNNLPGELYEKYISDSDVGIVFAQTYELLKHATAAVVTSGTATLETALFNVPEVVIYKTSSFTYRVGRLFYTSKYFSLVNLIMEEEVVKELLQFNLAADIRDELNKILNDKAYRDQMLKNFTILKNKLGGPGASQRVAEKVYRLTSGK